MQTPRKACSWQAAMELIWGHLRTTPHRWLAESQSETLFVPLNKNLPIWGPSIIWPHLTSLRSFCLKAGLTAKAPPPATFAAIAALYFCTADHMRQADIRPLHHWHLLNGCTSRKRSMRDCCLQRNHSYSTQPVELSERPFCWAKTLQQSLLNLCSQEGSENLYPPTNISFLQKEEIRQRNVLTSWKLFLAVLCLKVFIAQLPPTHPPMAADAHNVASGTLHCFSSAHSIAQDSHRIRQLPARKAIELILDLHNNIWSTKTSLPRSGDQNIHAAHCIEVKVVLSKARGA